MDESKPTAEAISIKDGILQSVGSADDVGQYKGNETISIDVMQQTIVPGFIDAHSHIAMALNVVEWANLSSPPVSHIQSIPQLIDELRKNKDRLNLSETDWVLGWGYDPDQLEEKRHPDATELSVAFPNNPVFILHVSGHMAVVNGKAMEISNITAETTDPAGGRIVRKVNSREPTGLLLETAMYQVRKKIPVPDLATSLEMLEQIQRLYAQHGITTGQDGFTMYDAYRLLKNAASKEQLIIDIECLASFNELDSFLIHEEFQNDYNGLRLTGVKIIADGSPQGKTAFFRKPYLTDVPGCAHSCRGMPTVNREQLTQLIDLCYSSDIQVFCHANGDASIEMLLDVHEEVTSKKNTDTSDLRTVVIHSQFVGEDQLIRYAKHDFIPSFFTNHAYFWGDVHIENLGMDRARYLSPLQSAKNLGITYTNHTDYTITPIDQMFLMWSAVNRKTRSGYTLGKEERVNAYDALKAITLNSAYQHQIESSKGSIESGKLADLVILDQNPLEVDPEDIKDIKVVETIKRGKSIYRRSSE